jgi:hypothetical protein
VRCKERERPPFPHRFPRLFSRDALECKTVVGCGYVGSQNAPSRVMDAICPLRSSLPARALCHQNQTHLIHLTPLPSPRPRLLFYSPFQTPFKEDENPSDWYNIVSLLVGIANLLAKVCDPQSIPQPKPKPKQCRRGAMCPGNNHSQRARTSYPPNHWAILAAKGACVGILGHIRHVHCE